MAATNRRHPTRVGDVLDGLTRRIGVKEKLEQYRVWSLWDEVVGPQTAAHAQPLRLRDSVLEVRVDHPVWMQQLQLLKPRILQRLNQALAPVAIADIHWRQGQPQGKTSPIPAAEPPLPPLRPLTAAEEEWLDRVLPPGDDEIHRAWRRLLTLHLQRRNDKP